MYNLKTLYNEKLLFAAALLTVFSGFANVKTTAKNVATMQNTSTLTVKKATQKDLEKKDAWFCYLASSSSSTNSMTGVTTTTNIYKCTNYAL